MVYRSACLVIVCLWMLMGHAWAVGKITVDPNQSGAAVEKLPDETDKRLASRLTYNAGPKSLVAVLDDLSRLTGVTLKAGYNKLDWQVRDRKMVIVCRDTPLASLMSSIARVMKFKWAKCADTNPPAYRLYMNRSLLLQANKLLKDQEDKTQRHREERRAEELASLLGAADLSAEQVEKLKQAYPELYAAHESGLPSALKELLEASPEAGEALASGRELILPFGSLSTRAQAALPALADAMKRLDAFRSPVAGRTELDTSHGFLMIDFDREESEQQVFQGRHYLGSVVLTSHSGVSGGANIPNRESPSEQSEYSIGIKARDEERPYWDKWKEMKQQAIAAINLDMQQDQAGEPLNEHEEDPSLDAKVTLKPEKPVLPEYQKALASAGGFAVVSDCFGSRGTLAPLACDKTAIKDVLQQIQDKFHYNWEKHDTILEFRDRYWYKKRSEQIPDAWMEDWRQTLRKNGTLDLEQIASVSTLTQGQYNSSLAEDEFFCGALAREMAHFVMNPQCKAFLTGYNSLSTDLRKALFSETGIPLTAWPEEPLRLLRRNLFSYPSYLERADKDIQLRATQGRVGKSARYTLTLTSEGLEPVLILVEAPHYEEPKETMKQPRGRESSGKAN